MNSKPHLLTDEICDSIAPWPVQDSGGYDCMRTAAEWQLIQVIEWLREKGYYFVETDGEGNFLDDPEPTVELLVHLMKAMRPQQQQQQEDN